MNEDMRQVLIAARQVLSQTMQAQVPPHLSSEMKTQMSQTDEEFIQSFEQFLSRNSMLQTMLHQSIRSVVDECGSSLPVVDVLRQTDLKVLSTSSNTQTNVVEDSSLSNPTQSQADHTTPVPTSASSMSSSSTPASYTLHLDLSNSSMSVQSQGLALDVRFPTDLPLPHSFSDTPPTKAP